MEGDAVVFNIFSRRKYSMTLLHFTCVRQLLKHPSNIYLTVDNVRIRVSVFDSHVLPGNFVLL